MTTWVPANDPSLPEIEGHTWQRGSWNCPDCQCCSLALCTEARETARNCAETATNINGDAQMYDALAACPCTNKAEIAEGGEDSSG